jgi:hypothetical protein
MTVLQLVSFLSIYAHARSHPNGRGFFYRGAPVLSSVSLPENHCYTVVSKICRARQERVFIDNNSQLLLSWRGTF